MNYFTAYDKVSFKDFKSATQSIVDSIPSATSLDKAILFFLEKYHEDKMHYDQILSLSIERNLKKQLISKETILFYILMALRARYPQFFPSPSICVLLSHALRGQMKKVNSPRIGIENIQLLPAALLIAHEATEIIVKDLGDVSASLQHFLKQQDFPSTAWAFTYQNHKPQNTIALAQFPLPQTAMDSNYLDIFDAYTATVALTSWNFLASEEFKALRYSLIKRDSLYSITQLPLPKREGNKSYPAVIVMNKEKHPLIHMYDLHTFNQECASKVYLDLAEEGIKRDFATYKFSDTYLQEIFGNIINNEPFPWARAGKLYKSYEDEYEKLTSAKIHLDEVLKEPMYKLSPVMYITQQRTSNPANTVKLASIAELIRCQEPRISLQGTMDVSLAQEEFGQNVFRDTGLKDIDFQTFFLVPDSSNLITMRLDGNKWDKYVLKDNDILLAFKGSKVTLGRIGFVDKSLEHNENCASSEDPVPAVPGTSFVIVRVHSDRIDPVWLFHYLQEKHIQEIISSNATGSTVLSVNLKALRELPVRLPSPEEVAEKTRLHSQNHEDFKNILDLRRRIDARKKVE